MKVSSKPISSPGRTEKFPPPLMRFLRSNVGSRSRGRRSSPMFVRKKNAAAIETQEPSSPKVTCMGQVRVRRSKQTGAKPGGGGKKQAAPTKRRCQWIRNALFCTHFDEKSKNKSFRPSFRKWVSFFHVGSRKKAEVGEESSTIEPKCGEKDEGLELESNEIDYGEEEDKNFVCPSSTPPRNALLLTRCRSAPYRSSSLANRFWGSPLGTEETEEQGKPVFGNREKHIENGNPTSESEPICGDSTAESRTDRESKCSIVERTTKSEEDMKTGQVCNVRPLLLTRCKSEPARTAEKLFDPVASYWRKGRLDFADSISPHVL